MPAEVSCGHRSVANRHARLNHRQQEVAAVPQPVRLAGHAAPELLTWRVRSWGVGLACTSGSTPPPPPRRSRALHALWLPPHDSRADDEARALIREAFTLSGDLHITGDR